ncbi:hypothetical protein PR202_gb21077 [Eleusine coracana subsp. coracana]|uniref:Secreted protein n=1 Tax=Eleusine coracana subsp. coracana TaxID=191504 RepID=A0AAV5FA97_ELECO|nr:hypothetical protein PR202_gb21077 [Eleusine coracana subsp. coracana]
MLSLFNVVLFLYCPAPLASQAKNGTMYIPENTKKLNLISLAGTVIAYNAELHSATGTASRGWGKVYSVVPCQGDSNIFDCHKRLVAGRHYKIEVVCCP